MKVAMTAINKFFYYAMNFGSKKMEVAVIGEGIVEKYMPDCFEAFPVSLRQHLYKKWESLYDSYGSRAVLMAFYAELDGTNRKLLMEWVINNYNGECKLSFKEEE